MHAHTKLNPYCRPTEPGGCRLLPPIHRTAIADGTPSEPVTALVCVDDAAWREQVVWTLLEEGYDVVFVEALMDVLYQTHAHKPTVLISDRMHVIRGYREFCGHQSASRCCAVVRLGDEEGEVQAILSGATEILEAS